MANKKVSVKCGEALTIAHSAELHQKLQDTLEKTSKIELVADSVEKVDSAGLQLIVALSRELEKLGGELTWKQPSETLVQAVSTLGLQEHLAV